MDNFAFYTPTKIYFGDGMISNLNKIADLGKNVLMVYGKSSIKRTGIYDKVINELNSAGMNITELSGVDPNPRIDSVREGVRLCRENNIDVVLAVGGGSSIDCAKVIAAGTLYDGDPWDLVLDGSKIEKALPVVAVLTMAATGSEMDAFAVISDMKSNDKLGTGADCLKPVFSILDPTFTFSVPRKHTIAGVADIMSHTFENYFAPNKAAYLQSRLAEAVLKTCIKYGPIAADNPDDYEARANIMWASSLAINGLLSEGADVAWTVHGMEHELSAYYDITHGEGLALLTPHWMEYVLSDDTLWKFKDYGVNVWGIDSSLGDMEIAKLAIEKTREFFRNLGLPMTLSEVGIGREKLKEMADKLDGKFDESFVVLKPEDVLKIYEAAL
ncbi:butanol dehydrogenase [Clostridiales bacterium S5-A14a]|nr:butanol dehydrogenase [Clostridiales bacterium S5-A14a]